MQDCTQFDESSPEIRVFWSMRTQDQCLRTARACERLSRHTHEVSLATKFMAMALLGGGGLRQSKPPHKRSEHYFRPAGRG